MTATHAPVTSRLLGKRASRAARCDVAPEMRPLACPGRWAGRSPPCWCDGREGRARRPRHPFWGFMLSPQGSCRRVSTETLLGLQEAPFGVLGNRSQRQVLRDAECPSLAGAPPPWAQPCQARLHAPTPTPPEPCPSRPLPLGHLASQLRGAPGSAQPLSASGTLVSGFLWERGHGLGSPLTGRPPSPLSASRSS